MGSLYMDVERTYNAYGFVTQELDPLNHATTFIPDASQLYPASVTNALSQTTASLYDYSAGKATQTIDPNGAIVQVVFDGLDRVIEEKQSSVATPSTLETKTTFTYTQQSIGTQMLKTDWLDSSIARVGYAYTDGFDRPIQTRTEAEGADTFVVVDTVYDTREYVWKQSLHILIVASRGFQPSPFLRFSPRSQPMRSGARHLSNQGREYVDGVRPVGGERDRSARDRQSVWMRCV